MSSTTGFDPHRIPAELAQSAPEDPTGYYANVPPPAPAPRQQEIVPLPDNEFQVPAGTAQVAAQAATHSPVDSLAEDAAASRTSKELPPWPEGSPEMRSMMRLPFRQRADAIRRWKLLEKSLERAPKKGDTLTEEKAAEYYDILADMDDFMATCAVDPVAYRAWTAADGGDEKTFGEFWAAFAARLQPGEASSSSS
jgi:hypothetical protein